MARIAMALFTAMGTIVISADMIVPMKFPGK